MDLWTFILLGHLIGLALGLGGATVSDVFFIRILKSKAIDKTQYQNLKVLSRVVWSGITLLIITGLSFLWRMYVESGTVGILNSPRFVAKLTLVGVVFLNGLVFHFFVFPRLKQAVGKKQALKKYVWLFSITGAISGASWYSIVVIAVLRGIDWSYLTWIGAYIGVLAGGIMTARLLIGRLLKN